MKARKQCSGGSIAGITLLSDQAAERRCRFEIAAEGVDVRAAAAGVAREHAEFFRTAALLDVVENTLDALLVEFVVLAEGDQVAQQAFAVDFAPS